MIKNTKGFRIYNKEWKRNKKRGAQVNWQRAEESCLRVELIGVIKKVVIFKSEKDSGSIFWIKRFLS